MNTPFPPLTSRITRPKGRVRIETILVHGYLVAAFIASPGRKAGCGLKQLAGDGVVPEAGHHPAERPGAD